jgi:hypothetical protein
MPSLPSAGDATRAASALGAAAFRAGADAAAARARRWALMLVGAASLVAFAYGAGTAAPKAVADFLSRRPDQGTASELRPPARDELRLPARD